MRRSINSQDIYRLFKKFRNYYCPWSDICLLLFRSGLEALVMYWSDSCSLAPINRVK
jgi:hypothetical protein